MADSADTARPAQLDRHQIEDEIERLIDLLDSTDPDPDLADSHDQEDDRADLEPSLGWSTNTNTGVICHPGTDDLEQEDEHDGPRNVPPISEPEQSSSPTQRPAPRGNKSIDQAVCTGEYAVVGDGDCMAPLMRTGDKVIVDADARARPRDIVLVHLAPEVAARWGYSCIVKRLAMDMRWGGNVRGLNGEKGILLEMLNPPRSFFLACHTFRVVHRVVEMLPAGATHTSDGRRLCREYQR